MTPLDTGRITQPPTPPFQRNMPARVMTKDSCAQIRALGCGTPPFPQQPAPVAAQQTRRPPPTVKPARSPATRRSRRPTGGAAGALPSPVRATQCRHCLRRAAGPSLGPPGRSGYAPGDPARSDPARISATGQASAGPGERVGQRCKSPGRTRAGAKVRTVVAAMGWCGQSADRHWCRRRCASAGAERTCALDSDPSGSASQPRAKAQATPSRFDPPSASPPARRRRHPRSAWARKSSRGFGPARDARGGYDARRCFEAHPSSRSSR